MLKVKSRYISRYLWYSSIIICITLHNTVCLQTSLSANHGLQSQKVQTKWYSLVWSASDWSYWVRSIQPKFPGWGLKISWCQMDRYGSGQSCSIPLTKQVSRSFKMEDVGSLFLALELDFNGDINDIVWAVSCVVLFCVDLSQIFAIIMSSNITFEWRKEHSKFSWEINHL